jgi:crotonobetainyl-CoA:carnitine CoA-transferase CaiB-like acyl-CoA transferase
VSSATNDTRPSDIPGTLDDGILKGIRVLDIGQMVAGPFIATLLGDFGAEVIKVERPGGDPMRSGSRKVGSVPLWWTAEARNKKSLVIDLRTEEGRRIFIDLVKVSDVVVENLRPGVIEQLGIGQEVLMAANPRLILARVSGYGKTGPYSNKPGFGKAVEAMSSIVDLTGFADGPPTHPGFPMTDISTSIMGAFAVMLALYGRDSKGSGVGEIIDLALYETPLRMNSSLIPEFGKLGIVPTRAGNRQPTLQAFGNCYCAADGRWLSVSGGTLMGSLRILEAIDRADLIESIPLRTMDDVMENFSEIDSQIASWIAKHDAKYVVEQFTSVGAVAALVYNIKDVFEDPHIQSRENIVYVDDEEIGKVAVPGVVPRLERRPGRVVRRGPRLGEDTVSVLSETLGMSEERIFDLVQSGVIGVAKEVEQVKQS